MTAPVAWRLRALILAAATLVPAGVAADTAAVLTATILAGVAPQGDRIEIGADAQNRPTSVADLEVRLAPLPADAAPGMCTLQLVLRSADPADERGLAIPGGQHNGVILELQDRTGRDPEQPGRTVASLRLPPETAAGTIALLRSRSLCEALAGPIGRKGAAPDTDRARFRLLTTTGDGRVVVAGGGGTGVSPRLTVSYEKPGALPGPGDWAQVRRDAQHSGRSAWRMYDPGGRFTPTSFGAAPIAIAGAGQVLSDLHQSPLLYGGRIHAVLAPSPDSRRLVAVDRAGRLLAEAPQTEAPRYLAAGSPGRIYYVTANHILELDPRAPSSVLGSTGFPVTESPAEAPTIGSAGTLFLVTVDTGGQRRVRALAPQAGDAAGTRRPLWEFATGQDPVGAVALSSDEATAYVLVGGGNPRLVALDAASGDCRWEQRDLVIASGENDPMPVPVVAGSDVLVTSAFPTGERLQVVHDAPADERADRGRLVAPPPVAACRATAAPGGMTVLEAPPGQGIPTAMAGVSEDALYILGGQLCWGRADRDGAEVEWTSACADLAGCDPAQTAGITLLIGDSASGESSPHLYALAAESRRLFFISANLRADGGLAPQCRGLEVAGMGPNLVLAPDGTLINVTEARGLQAIGPRGFEGSGANLVLNAELLRLHNDSTFRAGSVISTEGGLAVPAETNINLVAGERIVFTPGLRVSTGARLRARTGF